MGLLDEPGEKLQNTNHKIQTNSKLQCPKLQTAISRHWTGTFSDVGTIPGSIPRIEVFVSFRNQVHQAPGQKEGINPGKNTKNKGRSRSATQPVLPG